MKVNKENILGTGGTAVVFGGKWGDVDVAIKRIQVVSLDKSTNREEENMRSFVNVDNVLQLLDVQQDDDFKYNQELISNYISLSIQILNIPQVFNSGTLCCYC